MWLIYNLETGAALRHEIEPVLADGEGSQRLPPSALLEPPLSLWSPAMCGFMDVPQLTSAQILGLYTVAQHARARRMINAVYPAGHLWEGQLIDPDALTQRLVDATLTLKTPLPVTDPFHQNGTAWMRLIGVIESDEEAARIAAGITPEEAAEQ